MHCVMVNLLILLQSITDTNAANSIDLSNGDYWGNVYIVGVSVQVFLYPICKFYHIW